MSLVAPTAPAPDAIFAAAKHGHAPQLTEMLQRPNAQHLMSYCDAVRPHLLRLNPKP